MNPVFVVLALFALSVRADSCSGCYPGTSGPCISAVKVCYASFADGTCPPGTSSCGSSPTTTPPPVGPTVAPPSGDFPFMVYTNEWAQYRKSHAPWCAPYGYTPSHLTANLYTHVMYAFVRIDRATSTIKPVEYNAETLLIPQVIALKKTNPKLKVLVSVGGWGFSQSDGAFAPGSTFGDQDSKWIFPNVSSDASKRSTFVSSAIQFCQKWGFDGVDIDWEWPQNSKQKSDFTSLLRDLRAATSQHGLLLTTALRASPTAGFDNYELGKIHQYVDYVNLMTYDYHGGSFEKGIPTQVHTPVLDCANQTAHFDITGAVEHYLSQGVPAKKIVMGLATYGRTFRVADAHARVGATSLGAGVGGDCTMAPGTLAYYEIERALQNSAGSIIEDKTLIAAYATYNSGGQNNLVTFDTSNTHRLKMCWLRARGLGGVMAWDGESDDNQVLLRTIRSHIDSPQCQDFVMPSCPKVI
eukprot:TRINITY_DN36495_c0_g1_i2.p1 TRINITY_DN36495_c0_g1~~TRINITY_DN36495_c0_g1_i2.p1  ORF type:complete len:469 (+),score=116.08 TRINITY_DN36495_c0_g1_i2:2-1408(+)